MKTFSVNGLDVSCGALQEPKVVVADMKEKYTHIAKIYIPLHGNIERYGFNEYDAIGRVVIAADQWLNENVKYRIYPIESVDGFDFPEEHQDKVTEDVMCDLVHYVRKGLDGNGGFYESREQALQRVISEYFVDDNDEESEDTVE